MPLYPESLEEKVSRLERLVAELQAQVSQRGKLNVVQGGALEVLRADGTPVARIGEIAGYVGVKVYYESGQIAFYSGELTDGTVGTVMFRDDGTIAFSITGVPGQPQFAAIRDRAGTAIVTDDTTSGVGIGVPYIPWGPFVSASVPTDTTTSTSFVTLQSALSAKMNPRITMQILGRSSDASTTGEIRVVDEGGVQIGATISVAANAFQYYNIGATTLPGAFKANKSLNIQARVTAGPGTIGVRGIYALGVQS